MAAPRGPELETLFVPDADLSAYEDMPGRDIYTSFMRGVFNRHGLATEDRNLIVPFQGMYETLGSRHWLKTDDEVTFGDERNGKIETRALDDTYHTVHLFGPESLVTLSTMVDENIVKLAAMATQECQELFLSAKVSVLDPLTTKAVREPVKAVESVWVGNADDETRTQPAEAIVGATALRPMTPDEKRSIGVVIEGLNHLSAVAA